VGTGVDGNLRVVEILMYKSDGTTWTITQARPICRRFLPLDASFQRQAPNQQGDPEDIFFSVHLARTFARTSPWYDPAGTVSITYVLQPGGVVQCHLDPSV
jgi:hypothetical protein